MIRSVKGFAKEYERILNPYRNKPNVILIEIGVWYGKSLAMWADWFSNNNAKIYGVDICLKRYHLHRPELQRLGAFQGHNSVSVHQYDTSTEEFISWVRSLPDKPDIVVDDGNHKAESQWNLFKLIFPLLSSGGVYIIEDIVEPLIFFTSSKVGFSFLFAALADPDYIEQQIMAEQRMKEKLNKKHEKIQNRFNDMKTMIV